MTIAMLARDRDVERNIRRIKVAGDCSCHIKTRFFDINTRHYALKRHARNKQPNVIEALYYITKSLVNEDTSTCAASDCSGYNYPSTSLNSHNYHA